MSFFEGFTAVELIAALIAAAGFFYPGFGVILMNMLKNKLGLEGRTANLAIMAFLAVLSAGALAVTEGFGSVELNAQSLLALWGILYAMAQDAYKRIYPPA